MCANRIVSFEPRTSIPTLGKDEIHLWLCSLHDISPLARSASARKALERLLCGYAKLRETPRIERSAHGKPFAPDLPQFEFNLSHSGQHVLLAFAHRQALGVDIESMQRRVSTQGIAQRFFAPLEAIALARLKEPLQRSAFLHLWTKKEAVLKALGVGIGFGLERVEFAIESDGTIGALRAIAAEAGEPDQWHIVRLDPAPELCGTLAWCGPPRRLRGFACAQ